jgi:hypothetical protein
MEKVTPRDSSIIKEKLQNGQLRTKFEKDLKKAGVEKTPLEARDKAEKLKPKEPEKKKEELKLPIEGFVNKTWTLFDQHLDEKAAYCPYRAKPLFPAPQAGLVRKHSFSDCGGYSNNNCWWHIVLALLTPNEKI